jgi:adenylate cyclase
LALALCNAAYLAWADDPEANYGQSYELVQRAITLDARYAAARFVLGLICVWTGRSDRAMAEYQEAIKLNPNYAAAHIMLGAVFTYRGQAEKAIELAERGIRLSPGDPRLFMWLPLLAGAHYQLRHYLQAVEIGRRSWTLNPNWPAGLTYLVAGLAQLGRIDEARAALADLRGLDANFSFLRTTLQKLYTEQTGVDHILDGLHKAGFQ